MSGNSLEIDNQEVKVGLKRGEIESKVEPMNSYRDLQRKTRTHEDRVEPEPVSPPLQPSYHNSATHVLYLDPEELKDKVQQVIEELQATWLSHINRVKQQLSM